MERATVLLEDFRPLCESLEWQLGQLYYAKSGHQAFLSGGIPYLVNNSGVLSTIAAELFFESLLEREGKGLLGPRLLALEPAVGSGLFARGFLRVFERICDEQGKDYAARLTFIAADAAPAMLFDIRRHGLLDGFKARVRLAQTDVMSLDFKWLDGASETPQPFDAVFLNYVLDCLPAAVVRVREGAVEQLSIQTLLLTEDLADYTSLTPAAIVAAAAGSVDDRASLVDLYHLLQLRCRFSPAGQFESPQAADGEITIHTYAALECLHNIARKLAPEGFILISDYPAKPRMEADGSIVFQRFGASSAMGLNMTELGVHFNAVEGLSWIAPESDHHSLVLRMLANGFGPQSWFRQHCGSSSVDWYMQPSENASKAWREGRLREALASHQEAVRRCPDNWLALGEAAHFCGAVLSAHGVAKELATAALDLNPANPELWNTLGEALAALGQIEGAHDNFERALSLDPGNMRARCNLIDTLMSRRRWHESLRRIADALADDEGAYRSLLLERQKTVIDHISSSRDRMKQRLSERARWE